MADNVMGDSSAPADKLPGTYKDTIHELPDDVRLPTGAFPKAPDPKPFKVGEKTSGER